MNNLEQILKTKETEVATLSSYCAPFESPFIIETIAVDEKTWKELDSFSKEDYGSSDDAWFIMLQCGSHYAEIYFESKLRAIDGRGKLIV